MNMKKLWAFACIIAIITSLTACGGQASSSALPSGGNQLVSSGTEQGSTVSNGSAATVSGDATTSEVVTANVTSRVASPKALAGKDKGSYKVKTVEYSYNKDNMVYKASYLQLSGQIANLDKINIALKNCALQTINSLGTGKKAVKTTVRVNGDITYQGKEFISAGFNEYTTLSPKAKSVRVLRTVNISLKTGAPVAASALIVKNDALYKALEKAAKEQKDAAISTTLTAAAIKSGLDSNAIYFTDYGVGLSILTAGAEKRLTTVTLTYQEVQPFMTKNIIWKNFV